MKFVSELNSVEDLKLVGGKGQHLQKLIQWKAPVAPFFVITTEAFEQYQKSGQIPTEVLSRLENFISEHTTIALRSSMISEDQADSSFAGLFETILDVRKETSKKSLIKIFDSIHSDRVREYISRKNLKISLQMAVVAQKQINVQKSGVLFTRSPVEPTSAIAIDAAFGMGEGVVSGTAKVDHYQFTRLGEEILEIRSDEKRVLTLDESNELIALSLKLERELGCPCDIEWGYLGKSLYVFQIRPITRSFEPLKSFADTNLSESYPGVVSPFTARFVRKAYENVFKESALILGASEPRFQKLSFHYERLVSVVDNHLYYNLEHYYAVVRALPGGEKNIENWHKMIGGKPEGLTVPYHETRLTTLETLKSLVVLLKLAVNRRKVFGPFMSGLEGMRSRIEKEMSELKTSTETITYLQEILSRPLGFGITVVNDVFIMMGLAYLTAAFRKKGVSEDLVIDYLKTDNSLDSIKPLEVFEKLVKDLPDSFISALGDFEVRPSFHPYETIFEKMKSRGFVKEVDLLKAFLRDYGDRSFEELKLESLPLRNNPSLLFQLLRWAKETPSQLKAHSDTRTDVSLSWLDTKILEFTRDCISMREASRLWRGKFYHLIRSLVLKLGEQLASEDARWSTLSLQDFFSLNHLEWGLVGRGDLDFSSVMKLMDDRRGWQQKTKAYPEIIQWVETEKLPEARVHGSVHELRGQGVSPGTATGTALVLENPVDAFDTHLTDYILVTKNTDPAWVYIMSRSVGLISEKGSLLSHTAIIGRELSIPTIVGVKGATHHLRTGDKVRIDATLGTIEKL